MYYDICMVLKWADVTQPVWDRVPRYGYGLASAQSSVVSNIKQTVVLLIYILQQIKSCVGSYIPQVLLLWQKYITWTLTLLLRFIRQVSNSVCKLQYWKKCTPPLSDKLFSYCTASYMPLFQKSILQKCNVQEVTNPVSTHPSSVWSDSADRCIKEYFYNTAHKNAGFTFPKICK
jgi:hypothetical protein